MDGEYSRRREQGALLRKKKGKRVGYRIFIITLTMALGISIMGRKIGSSEYKQKTMEAYSGKESDYSHKDNREYVGEIRDLTHNKNPEDKKEYMDAKEIDDWRILLVNADNPVPKGYSVELSNVDGIRKFDSRAIDDLINLIAACRDETGCSIWAQSTYRDRSTQEQLFNDGVNKYINEGKSREEAEGLASFSIATPGTSEHQIGLAVDFNNINIEFENSQAFEWLMENSHKYGFILRYPKDKQSITKFTYEPWHFRYVGEEHASVMKQYNFCLEEYIDYLVYHPEK